MDLISALLVGIIAAIPVGPILLMVIQRTLCCGKPAGIMVGLGSALADALFAVVSLYTLSFIDGFIKDNEGFFMIAGGVLIAIIGIGIIRRKIQFHNLRTDSILPPIKYALQSFGSVLSNPAALVVMMTLLSYFGLNSQDAVSPIWLIIVCIALGELLYWLVVVFLLSRYINLKEKTISIFSKIVGSGICVFALVLIIRGMVILI